MKRSLTILTLLLLATSCANDGRDGLNGEEGATGEQGSPGTVVTPVQLCGPEFVPTYPDTLPEYALCIDSNLYGVYSTHGGFLTLIPPGDYHSNGLGATCDFTVGPDCEVTREDS